MTRDEALELAIAALDRVARRLANNEHAEQLKNAIRLNQTAMQVLTQMHFELEALPMWRKGGNEMDVPQYCPTCGLVLQVVRPGKWQCVHCEGGDDGTS